MGKKYDIFISYSRKDSNSVLPFVEELEARDFKVWIDISNIDYGATFPDHIAQALDESDSMLFMCTQNSVLNSPYCKKELGYARANGLNITAILVDGYMPKKGWFALEYNDVNCVNISDKKQLYRLFEALENKYFPERVAERKAKITTAREAARKKVQEDDERRMSETVNVESQGFNINSWIPTYRSKFTQFGICSLLMCGMFGLVGYILLFQAIWQSHSDFSWDWSYLVIIAMFVLAVTMFSVFNRTKDNGNFHLRYDELKVIGWGKYCYVSRQGRIGIVNYNTGQELLAPEYRSIERKNNYFILCNLDNKWGVYNCEIKKIIVPCKYDYVEVCGYEVRAHTHDTTHIYAANGSCKL